jgi:hypothetical protein
MPPRPSYIPHNAERTALQKMSPIRGLTVEGLLPAGPRTIAGMVAKGWIEGQLDLRARVRYRITLAGEAALRTPIPIKR